MTTMVREIYSAFKEAGVSEERASAAAEALIELTDKHDRSEEITEIKHDVAGLKQDVAGLKQDVASLKQDVADLKSDNKLLRWMAGFNLAFTMAILWKLFS